MKIKSSSCEGELHIALKSRAIELLKARKDIVSIDTEYGVWSKNGFVGSRVDVIGFKSDGGRVLIEVKSYSGVLDAIVQQMKIQASEADEFIIISKVGSLLPFKKIARLGRADFIDFVNNATIYDYDERLKLTKLDVRYVDGRLFVSDKDVYREQRKLKGERS